MPNKTEMTDYEQYEAMQAEQATAQNTPAKGPTEYEQYEAMLESPEEQSAANWAAIEGKDYVRSASKAVKPVYQAAIDKIDSLFDAGKVSNPTSAKKLRVQDKAAYLGLKPDDIKDSPEADVDQLVARKRAKEFANTYPDFVNKADQKSFEQIFTNPEAVKQINNSAKVRAMKATNLDKFMATNKAGLLSIQNTLSFLGPNGDFDEWAMTNQLVAAERKANNITTAGTSKLNAMWAGETSFVDIVKYILTDSEGFMAAYAEASNAASSIALSIAGKAAGAGAGAVVGSMGGPIGTVGGGLTGAFLAGGAAALDEYLQNEIATNYTDVNGNVNYAALKADIDSIKTKLRIEGLEHGVIGGAAEMFAPKIFAGLGKVATKVTTNIPAKVFKSATVKVLAKGGKFSGKVAAKGAEEFIGEGLSDFGPKTLIDFQNGRLNKNKLYTNYRDGLREGVAGAFTAGTIGTVSASVKAGAAALKEDSLKAPKSEPQDQAKPEAKSEPKDQAKPEAKPEPSYNTESKPMNERTPEEAAASAYKTNLAEDTLELTAALDDDTEAAERLEGMTDQEKVALIDSANTPSFTTEEGVVIEGNPEEIIVNGADLETLLGEDVAVVQSVLAQERQVELAQAVQVGEFFRFTYGEWVVSASKLIDKHPTINSLAVNTETEMTGYEAASHLSDQVDQMQIQFERLQTPAVESTPPAIPGISAEMTAESKPITLYHGTNTNFDELDYGIGGGMVFFGENEEVANRYANGAGGLRKSLSNAEVFVETDRGVRLDWDGKNFVSEDGEVSATEDQVNAAQGWDSPTSGDYSITPKDARVISKEVDPRGILDATTDEGVKEILRVLKPTNEALKRLIEAAKEQLSHKDGYNNTFSSEFWSISKYPSFREDLKDFTKQMVAALHTGVRFKDDSHISVALFDSNPAAISPRKQTGVVKAVTPTGNINQVSLQLIDGSTHLIDLYDKESAQDIQGISDSLAKQFEKALKASGRTTDTVRQASLQGIPVIMRVLVKRAKALGKPIAEMAKSITFKSDASSGSAYIGTNSADPSKVVYGVGRTAQRVSTVAHEFAHAILHFMTVDGPELEAQKQAGTITPEGLEYLSAIEATAKLLGLKDISDVNDSAYTTLTDPKTGTKISKNQSRQLLTKRTVIHEKLATTMEVFLKAGHLKTDAMETEIAKILLYWRSLIPSEVLSRQASVAAQEGWTYSGEYHQALDPSDEVGDVFHAMYSVNQQIDKTTVPMFNFSFFPVEILGKGGQMILDKVIQAKHTAIAKVFAKVYADSINARTLINTPEAIAKMNKELVEAYGATYSGELVNSLSGMGLKIPESLSKDLSNIQELLERYNPDQVPFVRDATPEDIEILMTDNPDAFDVGDTTSDVMARMIETFNGAKADIYQSTLNDLGYVNDDKVKQASEEMLATALPGILNDQFTQLVAAFPDEAKQLFAAYIKNGKVSSRLANKHVSLAAQEKIDNMTWKDLRVQALIKDVRDASTNVVNFFNQGKYIDALIAKYDELTKSEMLRLAPAIVKKLLRSVEAIESFGTLKYAQDNAGKVHPETMQYLRDTLNAVAAGTPVQYINIDRLDPTLNAFVDGITRRMVNEIAGKKLGTVATQIAIGDYARLMARVATAASTLEQEARDFMEQTKVNQAKVAVLKSTKVWDMTSWLPQANAIHEVFSTYFKSEAAYRDSAIGDIIYKIINGEAKAANETGEISTRLHEFTKKSLSRKLEPMTLPLTGIKITSRDDLISLMAYAGSESGRDTLLLTHNAVNVDPITKTITTKDSELQKDLDNMVADGTINADDIALVNAIWAEFAPMLKMIQEVYRRDRGIQVGEVKAMPFKVGGMELTGGYFPISYNEIIKVGESAKAEAAFYNVFNMSTFRRIKNRGEAKNTPVKFGLTPIGAYVNMTVREYYIIPEMKLFKAFVNDPEIKAHIETTRPGALLPPKKSGNTMREVGIINDWIASVENQVRSDVDPNTDKVINFLLKNTAYVFYAFDVISAVTNTVAGVPAAIPYATSKTRLALNALTWPLNISKHRKQMELSSVMKANSRNFVQYVLAENTEELYSASTTRKDFIERTAMWCQKVSQYLLESIVWNTEYEAALANGKKPDAAIKQADMVTERALGRYALSNKSLGQKAGNIGRLVNMASTHLVTFKRQHNVEIHRDGPLDRKMFMSAMIIGSAISSSMLTLSLFDKFTPDRPEEDEEAKKLRMKWQVATEMIPYFIGPYGRIISASVNIGFGSDIAITPMEHSIKKAIEGGKRLRVGLGTDYDMGVDDYAAVTNTLTMFTGVPFSGFANANDFVTAFRNHDDAAMKKLEDDAERAAFNTEFTEEFNEEYNPLID